jgi:CHAT domain-containing protein/tetratricopeptide (TPR) repeat protein
VSQFRGFPLVLLVLGALTVGYDALPSAESATARPSSPAIPVRLDSLTAMAESLYRAGNYVRARELWSVGLGLVQAGRNLTAKARILTSLGLTEWRLGEYEEARTRTEQARTLLEANDLRAPLPRTYNALGLIAWDQGRMSEAAELWRRTMQIAREVSDQEYVDKPAMNLGLWYAGIGDLEHAREAFATSLTAGRKLGIRALELRSLVNLAMVANQMGEPRLALAWLDSAAAARVGEDFLAEDNYRSQLASAAWALGDPGVALAGLDSAVREARLAGLRESEAANLTLMADIYWEAGDPARALGLHAQAEAIDGESNLPSEQGQNLYSAARIQAALGHTLQARGLASRALGLHQRAEDLAHQLDDRLLLAELDGPGQLTQARRIAGKLSTRAARIELGLAEARIAAEAARPRDLLGALASIAPDLAGGLSAEVSESEALRARAYASLNQWDSAAASGRRAIAALERIRSGHGSGLLRATFASFRAGTYGKLVAALLALGQTDEAFEVADAARGGWVQAHGSSGPRAHALTVSTAREELLRRIGSLENEIRSREEEGLDTSELRERLGRAEREYEIAVLSAGSGPSGAMQQDGRASYVRRALGPAELMLAYLVTPDQLFVFTVTRQHTRVRVVPVGAAEIEASVRLARQLLGDPTARPEEADAVLGTLSQWLLGPVGAGVEGVRRLVLVPHGALAYLPFGALKTPTGKYLVERYSLVHLPSASFVTRGRTGQSPEGGAGVKVTALAPLPRDLPATALEVSAVGRAQRGARVLVGRRADESALRQALRSGDVVHVASHGVLNGMNPLFSRIELVPGPTGSPADDGHLEVHEVLGLEIQSPLVFLSGCETGLGPGASRRYSPGEDYATLAAAFLAAGAGQVVSTLWAIPDTGAAVFAARFYAELGRTGTAEALAAAQRALLAEGRFRHPYYWAGYRLAGSESTERRAAVP